MDLYNNL